MFANDRRRTQRCAFARNSIAGIAAAVVAVTIAAAQDLSPAIPRAIEGTSAIIAPGVSSLPSLSGAATKKGRVEQMMDAGVTEFSGDFAEGQTIRPGRPQRITLEQVKQQSANRVAAPIAH